MAFLESFRNDIEPLFLQVAQLLGYYGRILLQDIVEHGRLDTLECVLHFHRVTFVAWYRREILAPRPALASGGRSLATSELFSHSNYQACVSCAVQFVHSNPAQALSCTIDWLLYAMSLRSSGTVDALHKRELGRSARESASDVKACTSTSRRRRLRLLIPHIPSPLRWQGPALAFAFTLNVPSWCSRCLRILTISQRLQKLASTVPGRPVNPSRGRDEA